MISRYSYNNLKWIDLESPTKNEIAHIMEEFDLPQLVAEEMTNSTLRSKSDLYEKCIYVILHFPFIHKETNKNYEQEIDFIIGKEFIITLHYEPIDTLDNFAKKFEVSSLFEHGRTSVHGGYLFMEMMKDLYLDSLKELDYIMDIIKKIEDILFKNQEIKMVKKLLETSRQILDFKQALRFHSDILNSYESASLRFFGNDYSYYSRIITAEFNKVNNLLEGLSETFKELQRTNDSLLSSRTNQIVKSLTIITFSLMPLSVVTGVFMMNTTDDMILIRSPRDFFLVILSMIAIGLALFIYFRHRKWI